MRETAIEWTEATWNPVFGCTKVSPGCQNCYAERIATRWGKDFSKVELKPHKVDEPLHMQEPKMIFVNSMSDLFHEQVPDLYIDSIFAVMLAADWHTYQILTKRPRRMWEYIVDRYRTLPDNIWVGTSIEMPLYFFRADELRRIPSSKRFISAEPLLQSFYGSGRFLKTVLNGIHWVITGGESDYRNPRPANPEWFREIRDECQRQGIAYFHKQNGGSSRCKCHNAWGCRLLDGRTHDDFPISQINA